MDLLYFNLPYLDGQAIKDIISLMVDLSISIFTALTAFMKQFAVK